MTIPIPIPFPTGSFNYLIWKFFEGRQAGQKVELGNKEPSPLGKKGF